MHSESNPASLRPVQTDEFLPSISLWISLGGLLLLGTVGAAFTLAAFVKYNVIVKAPAAVRPSGEVRLVQAAKEGVVKSILVKENQVVKQGDAIATIDDSQLQTQKSQLQGSIQQNQRQLAQIAAQLQALNSQRVAESNLMNRTIASAQADLSRNQRDYRDKQITTIASVQETEAALELAKEELKRYQQMGNTGAISQLQIKEKEQAFKAAVARHQGAKAGLNPSDATVAIAQERIAQEKARGESTLATLNKEQESLLQRKVEIHNQLNRDASNLQQIDIELNKTVIQAPTDGTIFKLELRNASQVVRAGEGVAQIAPSNTPIIVKARIAAQDISKVRVCKQEKVSNCAEGKVQMLISAYPYPDYGTLKGAVRAIAPDAILPQSNNANVADSTSESAALYYEVTIQPEKPSLVKGDREYPIQPGMEVTAEIISRRETVLTFILRKARLLTNL